MICVLGGCHVDVIAKVRDHFSPGTSCPGSVETKSGGVARNVARLLSSSGCGVAFYGRVGADEAGEALRRDLVHVGIGTLGLVVDPDAFTGRYVAIHDENGSLVAAVSDLSIYDKVSTSDLPRSFDGFNLVFADCNMPADVLECLGRACPCRLVIDAISAAKVGRLADPMMRGALVTMNRATASAFLGRPYASAAEAAEALMDRGALRAVITDGGQPLAIVDRGAVTSLPVRSVPMEDETGAGDALTAGVLMGLHADWSLLNAVGFGVRLAAAALQTRGALGSIPQHLLEEFGFGNIQGV